MNGSVRKTRSFQAGEIPGFQRDRSGRKTLDYRVILQTGFYLLRSAILAGVLPSSSL